LHGDWKGVGRGLSHTLVALNKPELAMLLKRNSNHLVIIKITASPQEAPFRSSTFGSPLEIDGLERFDLLQVLLRRGLDNLIVHQSRHVHVRQIIKPEGFLRPDDVRKEN
jgi:hypothetical protein